VLIENEECCWPTFEIEPKLHQKRPKLEQNGTKGGKKELRRSTPAASSKLCVQKQQKGCEALLKTARIEEDAITKNGQREKRKDKREREKGRGARLVCMFDQVFDFQHTKTCTTKKCTSMDKYNLEVDM
jgi:hypothetical protein